MVLRKVDYGEADRIFTLLTRQHGKVGAIAKGIRRSPRSLAATLELFSTVDVQLARGRNLDVVLQAVRLPGPRVTADLERTAHAALITELADHVTEERHPLDGIYELTVRGLEEVAQEPEPRRATAYFMMAALDLLGYAPELTHCVACHQPLPEAPAAFSPPAGGVVCATCMPPGAPVLPVRALKVLRVMASGSIGLYRRLRLEPPLLAEVENVLEAQLEYHLDRRLKSLRILRQMRSCE